MARFRPCCPIPDFSPVSPSFWPSRPLAATLAGKVVKVADGDTVTIIVGREQHRVRPQGIDAPEGGQAYGKASGRSLAAVVPGKQVRVVYEERDRYGRIVGEVWAASPDCAKVCPKTLDTSVYELTVGSA